MLDDGCRLMPVPGTTLRGTELTGPLTRMVRRFSVPLNAQVAGLFSTDLAEGVVTVPSNLHQKRLLFMYTSLVGDRSSRKPKGSRSSNELPTSSLPLPDTLKLLKSDQIFSDLTTPGPPEVKGKGRSQLSLPSAKSPSLFTL